MIWLQIRLFGPYFSSFSTNSYGYYSQMSQNLISNNQIFASAQIVRQAASVLSIVVEITSLRRPKSTCKREALLFLLIFFPPLHRMPSHRAILPQRENIMSISERYRQILERIDQESDHLYEILPESTNKALRLVDIATEELQDLVDSVGEIPQFQLEAKLSPVLLDAHGYLDRARVMLEKDGHQRAVDIIWELEQGIYRLLNDL